MRSGSRLSLPLVLAIVSAALLTGCVDAADDAPTPSPTPSTPTPTATTAPEPQPTATAAPVTIDCVSLVPADAFAMLFGTVTLQPSYQPPAGSIGAEVREAGGTVCEWTASDGRTVSVGVAPLESEELTARANELVVSSNSVPTYGIEGYFQVVDGVGEVQAFDPPYWIVATSTAFTEPGEVESIIASVVAALSR